LHPLLLRKYIGYARKYCSPKLTKEACRVLQLFYMTLREKHKCVDGTPITTRQLESMVRLSEARAKLELRTEVTEYDAKDVVEIMKDSLFDVLEDEFGNIDFRRTTGMSKLKQVKVFISALDQRAKMSSNNLFSKEQLLEIKNKLNLRVDCFDDFLDQCNFQGFLLKKGNKTYELCTSS